MMTKDVLVTVSGILTGPEDADRIELTTGGSYYYKNGKHYILYEETGEDVDSVVKNTVVIGDDHVDVRKKGAVDAQMSFHEGCKLNSFYTSVFGQLELGIITDRIEMKEEENRLELSLKYQLEINNEYVSENCLRMLVQARQ